MMSFAPPRAPSSKRRSTQDLEEGEYDEPPAGPAVVRGRSRSQSKRMTETSTRLGTSNGNANRSRSVDPAHSRAGSAPASKKRESALAVSARLNRQIPTGKSLGKVFHPLTEVASKYADWSKVQNTPFLR